MLGRRDSQAPQEPARARGERASYREGLSISALGFGVMVVMGLVSAVATARIYGVTVIGQLALVLAPVNAVWYLSSVREQAALMRELATLPARAPRITGLFAAVLAFSSCLTLVVAALAMVVTYFLYSGPIGHPDLLVPALVTMAGYVLFTNPAWNWDTVLNAFRAARQLLWVRLHQIVVFLAVAVALGLAWGTIWGLVVATVISSFTSLIHRIISAREFIRLRASPAELRDGFTALPDLIRFGLKITPGTLAEGVSNESGTWALAAFGSLPALGAYNRAWTLGRRLIDATWRINEMLYPTLVERRAQGDSEGFDRALVDTIRYSAAAMMLPAAIGGGAAYGVMAIFGPGFERASDALALLLLMPAMFTVSDIQRHALFSVDRPVATTVIAVARMLTTLLLCVPLTIALDATGAALAIIAGLSLELTCMLWTTRRHLAQPLHRLWAYRQMLAVGLAYAFGFGAARAVDGAMSGLLGTISALAAGSILYAAAFVLARGLGPRDRERWETLRGNLAQRRLRRLTPQGQL